MPEIFDFENEVDAIDKQYARYPPITEIGTMCDALGEEKDNFRTIKEADAWAYYWELLERVVDRFPREVIYEKAFYFKNLSREEVERQIAHVESLKKHRKSA